MTMAPSIIDTHAHLDMQPFDNDRAEVIARAYQAGVSRIINIGIDLDSSRESIRLAEAYPQVFATVGFHPHDADKIRSGDLERLEEMARHSKVVGIGEIGLDFYRDRSSRGAQIQALERQLELASRLGLPAIIHCREAAAEMTTILGDWTKAARLSGGKATGVIHCFSGDADTAQIYLDMGFHIAIGAYVGYPKSGDLRRVVGSIPADRLLLETDCPFLPPQKYRGKRNESSYITMTLEAIAQARASSPETIAQETTRNAIDLFRLPPI